MRYFSSVRKFVFRICVCFVYITVAESQNRELIEQNARLTARVALLEQTLANCLSSRAGSKSRPDDADIALVDDLESAGAATNEHERADCSAWPTCLKSWPDDADIALVGDLESIGATTGCLNHNCRDSDRFAASAAADCAEVCHAFSKCSSWEWSAAWDGGGPGVCQLRRSASVQRLRVAGTRTCVPKGSLSQGNAACFPAGSAWSYNACCDSSSFGRLGNMDCWVGDYTWKRCCFPFGLGRHLNENVCVDGGVRCGSLLNLSCADKSLSLDQVHALWLKVDFIMADIRSLYARRGFELSQRAHQTGTRLQDNFGSTGGGICETDVELFVQLSGRLDPAHIFIVGNAFGFSTLTLAKIFPEAAVDVLDAEVEGTGNSKGSALTRQVAREEGMNVQLTKGFSPTDTEVAMRGTSYELAFIDGKHTVAQLQLDFEALRPHLATKSVVVAHDVVDSSLHEAVIRILAEHSDWRYLRYHGYQAWNTLGTGILIKKDMLPLFCDLGSEPYAVRR